MPLTGDWYFCNSKNNIAKRWGISKDYGIFKHVLGNYFDPEATDEINNTFSINSDELYKYLNKKGALFIDTSEYEQKSLRLNLTMGHKGIFSVRVNVNYLNKFPIYDINGQKIEVSEEDTDRTIIIPEKFKEREENIKEYFEKCYIGDIKWDEKMYNHIPSAKIINQKIKIIYAKNSQYVFSMNSEVFPNENNMIKEPIIEVITEKNSCIGDRLIDTNAYENMTFKVKLINQDPKLTYQKIFPN